MILEQHQYHTSLSALQAPDEYSYYQSKKQATTMVKTNLFSIKARKCKQLDHILINKYISSPIS